MDTEFRFCELRREGRVLQGTAISYSDTARVAGRAERFLAGALGDVGRADIILNFQHDRTKMLARTGGGGLVLTDSPTALEVRAELPETREADDVLALIQAKVLRGLSLEFRALETRMEGLTRVVVRAELRGLGVVDRPAYSSSTVSARAEVEPPARWELIL